MSRSHRVRTGSSILCSLGQVVKTRPRSSSAARALRPYMLGMRVCLFCEIRKELERFGTVVRERKGRGEQCDASWF